MEECGTGAGGSTPKVRGSVPRVWTSFFLGSGAVFQEFGTLPKTLGEPSPEPPARPRWPLNYLTGQSHILPAFLQDEKEKNYVFYVSQ